MAILLTTTFLLLAVLVLAATSPAFVSPTPANGSNISGSVYINFTFLGTAHWQLFWNNGSGWVEIQQELSQTAPDGYTWDTTDAPDHDDITVNLTVINSTDAGDTTTIFLTGLTVDNNAPSVYALWPGNGVIQNSSEAFFLWLISDTIDKNVSCGLYIDGALNLSFGNETNSVTYNMTDGFHEWYLNCTDYTGAPIGRYTISPTWNFTIDTVWPNITSAVVTPRSNENYTNETPWINVTIAEQGTLDECEYSIDMGANWQSLNITGSSCFGLAGPYLHNMLLNFTFRVNDTAGNTRLYNSSINLTVDKVRPTLTFNSPADQTVVSDGYSFTINLSASDSNAGIIDQLECSVTLGGSGAAIDANVSYNLTTGYCYGPAQVADPSGLSGDKALVVFVPDAVNNTRNVSITLDVDTTGPSLSTATTNMTNNAAHDLNETFLLTATFSDVTRIDTVFVANVSSFNMTNTTAWNGASQTFTLAANASVLGCASYGLCVLHFTTNDSWGNIRASDSFDLIIDSDSPKYSLASTNVSGIVQFEDHVRFSALWSDHSLQSGSTTTATLYKYIGKTPKAIDTILLNDDLQWSNFTYLINVTRDEGRINKFYIRYADLKGTTNRTQNFSIQIQNSTPRIAGLGLLNNISNFTTEIPQIVFRIGDEGWGFTTIYLNLTTEGTTTTYTHPSSVFNCTLADNLTAVVAKNQPYGFNLSYWNMTPYRVTLGPIDFNDASPALSTAIFHRDDYVDPDGVNTTMLGVGQTGYIGRLGITVLRYYNDSGQLKANVTLTDTGYEEYLCNFTPPSARPEAAHTATLFVDDSTSANSSTISWLVDGYRPIYTSVQAASQYAYLGGAQVAATINLTQVAKDLVINWTLNESNLRNLTLTVDGLNLLNDWSGSSENSTDVGLEPGYHEISLSAQDVTYGHGGSDSNASFVIYLNAQTDYDARETGIRNALNTTGSLNRLTILADGSPLSGPAYLNKSFTFRYGFNLSSIDFDVRTASVDGLAFNWNATRYLALDLDNGSTVAAEVAPNTGVQPERFALFENHSRSATDALYTQFYPRSVQATTWNFTVAGDPFIVLLEDHQGDDFRLLSACSVGSPSVTTFAEACYTNASDDYLVFAPALTGIAVGSDVGPPNITIHTPAESFVVNNSFLTFNFSVIEPSPASGTFCSYEIWNGNTSFDSASLPASSFELRGARYYYNKTFMNFSDSKVWYLNITCSDSYAASHTVESNFTVNDSIAPIISSIVATPSYYDTRVNIFVNELSKFKVEYDTSSLNLTHTTSLTDSYRYSQGIQVTGLTPGTKYYYRAVACDQKNQCSRYPTTSESPSSFTTLPVIVRRAGGGGGGGGGALGTLEGTVIETDYRGWSVLPSGWLEYMIDKEKLVVSGIGVLLDNATNNAYIEVKGFFGKPRNVPEASYLPYQYFQINHNRIAEHASAYNLEFRVPTGWLENVSATTDKVHFYRYEFGNWTEYPFIHTEQEGRYEYFTLDLPGFSFFVVSVDGVLPTESNESIFVPPPIIVNTSLLNETEEVPEPETETKPTTETKPVAPVETVSGYGESTNIWWFIGPGILILVAAIIGSAYIYWRQRPGPRTVQPASLALSQSDPLYHLQSYILKALDHGHHPKDIKEKLLSVGWDELIIDEELQRVQTRRI